MLGFMTIGPCLLRMFVMLFMCDFFDMFHIPLSRYRFWIWETHLRVCIAKAATPKAKAHMVPWLRSTVPLFGVFGSTRKPITAPCFPVHTRQVSRSTVCYMVAIIRILGARLYNSICTVTTVNTPDDRDTERFRLPVAAAIQRDWREY